MEAGSHNLVIYLDLGDTLVRLKRQFFETVAMYVALLGGCLLNDVFELSVLVKKIERMFKDEWAFHSPETFRHIRQKPEEYDFWVFFFTDMLNRHSIIDPSRDLVDYLARAQMNPHSFQCFPDVKKTLDSLGDLGIEFGVISNAFPSASDIMDHLKLTDYFKYRILSCEPPFGSSGVFAKPMPDIYKHAIKCAGHSAYPIFFVDDRPSFVQGASDAGMRAFLIDREERFPDWHGQVTRIASLTEIKKHLRVPIQTNVFAPRRNHWDARIETEKHFCRLNWNFEAQQNVLV
jgi:FMN phosphatase YigB (HAD superfamily)